MGGSQRQVSSETPCKSARPSWIPSLIWSDTVGPPTPAVGLSPQLQLRTPNALGSALTGMATPTATLSATAALNNTFVITRCRAIGRGAWRASRALRSRCCPQRPPAVGTGSGRAIGCASCPHRCHPAGPGRPCQRQTALPATCNFRPVGRELASSRFCGRERFDVVDHGVQCGFQRFGVAQRLGQEKTALQRGQQCCRQAVDIGAG